MGEILKLGNVKWSFIAMQKLVMYNLILLKYTVQNTPKFCTENYIV